MLGLALDVVALWVITSLLARQNMADEFFRFFLLAAVLLAVGLVLFFAGLPPLIVFAIYFGFLLCGMRYWIGATWLGSVIGAVAFVAYRLVLESVL